MTDNARAGAVQRHTRLLDAAIEHSELDSAGQKMARFEGPAGSRPVAQAARSDRAAIAINPRLRSRHTVGDRLNQRHKPHSDDFSAPVAEC